MSHDSWLDMERLMSHNHYMWSDDMSRFFNRALDMVERGVPLCPSSLRHGTTIKPPFVPVVKQIDPYACTACKRGRMETESQVERIDILAGTFTRHDVIRCSRCHVVFMTPIETRNLTEEELANFKKCHACKKRLGECTCPAGGLPPHQTLPRSRLEKGTFPFTAEDWMDSPLVKRLSLQPDEFIISLMRVMRHQIVSE